YVAVTEGDAAGHVPSFRLAFEGVTRPLASPLPLHVGDDARHGEQYLVAGGVERELLVFQIAPNADAAGEGLLEDVPCFELLAPEPRLFANDKPVERSGLQLQGVQEAHEPWTRIKFGAGDAVVGIDVILGDLPAVPNGVSAGMFDLAGNGLLL